MFQFSLQTALNVRSRQEKVKMKELAEKVAVQQRITDELQSIAAGLLEQDGALDLQKKEGRFTIEDLKNTEHYKNFMHQRSENLNLELAKAHQEVEEKRLELVQAAKQRKTLDVLADREKTRYLAKVAREERMQMDEVASNLFYQKRVAQSAEEF